MKDKISVIIPCYNVEKYVGRCFDSVLQQTYGFEQIEVIFIDDQSTDGTVAVLDSFQKQYPDNVRVLKPQQKGMEGGARNLGMDAAGGTYLTFLDADDCMHPAMLSVLWEKMQEEDYDMVQCGARRFHAKLPDYGQELTKGEKTVHLQDVNERKNLIIQCSGGFYMCAWGKLFRRAFLAENNIRFLEGAYFVDNHFSVICILLAEKYCSVSQELLYYYENNAGITEDTGIEKIRDLVRTTQFLKEEINQRGIGESCFFEIQAFILWKAYFETLNRLEAVFEKEKAYYKNSMLGLYDKEELLKNPYIKGICDEQLLQKITYLSE